MNYTGLITFISSGKADPNPCTNVLSLFLNSSVALYASIWGTPHHYATAKCWAGSLRCLPFELWKTTTR